MQPLSKDQAVFNAIATKDFKIDTTWSVTITYINNNTVALRGFFKDTSFTKPEGPVAMYDNNGNKTTEGTYNNGKQTGLWMGWNENGSIIDSSFFSNDTLIIHIHFSYNNNGEISSRVYTNNSTNDKEVDIYTDNILSSEMHFINGNESEIDKGYYPNGQAEYVLTKKRQKIIAEKYYSDSGYEITKKEYNKNLPTLKFTEPEFGGGMNSFVNYISSALKRNHSLQDEISYVKQITIIFYLDSSGKPYDIKLSPDESMEFTKVIVDTMNNMPRWKMNGLKSYGPLQRTIRFIL